MASKHYCVQCGKDMGHEWILGSVCGKCVRANHRHVVTGKGKGYKGHLFDSKTGKKKKK
jgi:NMD protein affecting ribosome stability and mRNA decay